jgi:hypothetical protein
LYRFKAKKPKIRASKNKLKQANFKIKSDSIDLVAVKPNLNNTSSTEVVQLNSEGLKAMTDVEEKFKTARSRS